MKLRNCIVAFALGAFALSSCSEDDDLNVSSSDVPEAVLKAFETNYGKIQDVKWEKKNNFNIARFQTGAIVKSTDTNVTSAWYDDLGSQQQVDQEIPFANLPDAVKSAFETIYTLQYTGWEADDDAHVIDRLDMGLIYVIEIEKGETERELSFSPTGILLKDVLDDDLEDILPVIIPEKIKELIATLFPDNLNIQFLEIETDDDDGSIEVDILDGGVHKEVTISKDGKWMNTSYDVDFATAMDMMDAINPEVLAKLMQMAAEAGFDLNNPAIQDQIEVTVVDDALKGLYFEIEIEVGEDDFEIVVDKDGNITFDN